jgi:hypothetical protein
LHVSIPGLGTSFPVTFMCAETCGDRLALAAQ